MLTWFFVALVALLAVAGAELVRSTCRRALSQPGVVVAPVAEPVAATALVE